MSRNPTLLLIAQELGQQKSLSDITFKASGAFKETFRATKKDNSYIALKILNPAKCDLVRTTREVEAMTKCDSDYIGKLYDFGSFTASDGNNYLYMLEEFFDGGTLSEKLSNPIAPDIVRNYAVCLTNALVNLKKLSIVHRDIKPDNIMFGGTADTPILVDFGLVRDLSASSLTQTWLPQGPGTPYYAAPEQLNNEKYQIGWRTDQFSLGIVLGFCLTLEHPFTETGATIPETVSSVAKRHKCTESFRQKVTDLGFENIIKMLEPWAVHRFSDPADLLKSFER
jgi:serine/threonine protein kinase